MMQAVIPFVAQAAKFPLRWDQAPWAPVAALAIKHFHKEGSTHRPRAQVKLGYDPAHLYAVFRVEDRFVRAKYTGHRAPVYCDSCVEAFLEPGARTGYINFETNAGGTILANLITDPARVPGGFKAFTPLNEAQLARVAITSTLPHVVWPEISEPTTWELGLRIPFALLTEITGVPAPVSGTVWRGNFFKCADESTHPHWAEWAPVGEELNFHQPAKFGQLQFG